MAMLVALASVLVPAACGNDPENESAPATSSTPPSGEFTSVSAAYLHTCGVRTHGSAACWGYGLLGQSTPPAGEFTSVSARGTGQLPFTRAAKAELWR